MRVVRAAEFGGPEVLVPGKAPEPAAGPGQVVVEVSIAPVLFLDTQIRSGLDMESSAKYRNVGINPNVAFVVDDAVSEGAAGTRFVEIRGQAERVSVEPAATAGVSPQIIRIHPRRVISWNVDPDHPSLQTRDVAGNPGPAESQAHFDGARDG
jgi:PPOX class F420-dependent enzyme/OxyR family protein